MRTVEYDIPVPARRTGLVGDLRRLDRPGATMFIEYHGTSAPDRFQNRVIGLGRKLFGTGSVTTRAVTEKGVAGIRIWRVK